MKEREHIYVIVRIDLLNDGRLVVDGDMKTWEWSNERTYGPLPLGISATKAYREMDIARAEALRLNAENAHRNCRYFVTLARLPVSDALTQDDGA